MHDLRHVIDGGRHVTEVANGSGKLVRVAGPAPLGAVLQTLLEPSDRPCVQKVRQLVGAQHLLQDFPVQAQQMGAAQQQMNAMMAQMQEQMKNMSEEQRAQMQQMMESRMASGGAKIAVKTTVQKKGEDTVAGVSCTNMMILANGKPSGEVCVAQAGVLGLDTADYHSMVNATDTVRRLMERVTGRDDNDTVSMNMRVMKGIPVRMRDLMDGDVSTLTSRSSVDLDAGMFRVPDGYQKRDMLQ